MTNAPPMPRGGGFGDGREAHSLIELKISGDANAGAAFEIRRRLLASNP
jgi:hypothetical protein